MAPVVFTKASTMASTLYQRKQKALIAAHRRYKSLGHAYRVGPVVKPMLISGLSQRQIAAELTRLRVPTPAEWNHESRSMQKNGTKAWNQTQVSRLLKALGEVTRKMRWYYIHAHRELKGGIWDGSGGVFMSPTTGEQTTYKLLKHKRKTPGEHYQAEAWKFRVEEMEQAGYQYDPEDMGKSWKRFRALQSYHRRKRDTLRSP